MNQESEAASQTVNFEIDEVLIIKGAYFKVVLVDFFTGKIGLKRISKSEAEFLQKPR